MNLLALPCTLDLFGCAKDTQPKRQTNMKLIM